MTSESESENPRNGKFGAIDSGRPNLQSGDVSRVKRLGFRFLLIGFALLLVVACGELPAVLGLVDFRLVFKNYGMDPRWSPLNRVDSELIHVHKPHLRYQGHQFGGDITYEAVVPQKEHYDFDTKYDRNGFRNARDLEQADIEVIGDSFIEAATVGPNEMLTARLEHIQHRAVANLGQLWYGPQQELAVLKRYGLALRAKVVVWAFYSGNDLRDFSHYEGDKQAWVKTAPKVHSLWRRSLSRNVAKSLVGLAGLGQNRNALLPQVLVGYFPKESPDAMPIYFSREDGAVMGDTPQTFGELVTLLADAWRLVHATNARMIVAYIPTKSQVYRDLARFDADSPANAWKKTDLPQRLRAALAEKATGVEFVDLTPDLYAAAAKGELVYFRDDTHWTARGNEVAAQTIHRAIARL